MDQEWQEISVAYQILDRQVKKSCQKDKQDWIEQRGYEAQEVSDQNGTNTLYRIVHDFDMQKAMDHPEFGIPW